MIIGKDLGQPHYEGKRTVYVTYWKVQENNVRCLVGIHILFLYSMINPNENISHTEHINAYILIGWWYENEILSIQGGRLFIGGRVHPCITTRDG